MANQAPAGLCLIKDASNNTVGIKDASGAFINPMQLSKFCLFYLPWFKDASNNVIDKSSHGDAAKRGVSAAAATRGYFTSVAGTYGSGGTGRYWEVPSGNSNFLLANSTVIIHIGFNKAAPSGTENFAGTQHSSSTSGVLLAASAAGALTVYYKPGTTQNNFTALAGIIDGTDHTVSIVFDRLSKNGYIYLDGLLKQTKTDFDFTGTPSALQTFVFGGYSAAAAYDAKFFDVQMYAISKDLADIPLGAQGCVDKMTLYHLPLTTSDLGG